MKTSQQQKILVIDDDVSIRSLLSSFLASRGYQVFQAATGTKGVEAMADTPADLVLLDLGLPDMTGLEVLKKIRKSFPQAVVLMLSGSQDEKSAREALRFGAYDYLTKPIDLETLATDFLQRILG